MRFVWRNGYNGCRPLRRAEIESKIWTARFWVLTKSYRSTEKEKAGSASQVDGDERIVCELRQSDKQTQAEDTSTSEERIKQEVKRETVERMQNQNRTNTQNTKPNKPNKPKPKQVEFFFTA